MKKFLDPHLIIYAPNKIELWASDPDAKWKGEVLVQQFSSLANATRWLVKNGVRLKKLTQEKPIKQKKVKVPAPLSCDISKQQTLLTEKQARIEQRFEFWAKKFNMPSEEDEFAANLVTMALDFLANNEISAKYKIDGFCGYVLDRKPKSKYALKQLFDDLH